MILNAEEIGKLMIHVYIFVIIRTNFSSVGIYTLNGEQCILITPRGETRMLLVFEIPLGSTYS